MLRTCDRHFSLRQIQQNCLPRATQTKWHEVVCVRTAHFSMWYSISHWLQLHMEPGAHMYITPVVLAIDHMAETTTVHYLSLHLWPMFGAPGATQPTHIIIHSFTMWCSWKGYYVFSGHIQTTTISVHQPLYLISHTIYFQFWEDLVKQGCKYSHL